MASYTRTFSIEDLTDGVLVVDHGLGEKYPMVVVYDEQGRSLAGLGGNVGNVHGVLGSIDQTASSNVITIFFSGVPFDGASPGAIFNLRVVV